LTRDNNFDLVRLVLAVIVVFDHCYGASASASLIWLPRLFSSQLAVEGFFVISGFLIFASYERSRSLRDYFSRRARRIVPGYLASTLLALGIGLLFNHRLFAEAGTYRFLLANLTLMNFLHPNLPGVFVGGRYIAVNFALWTIKVEVMFYLAVPVLVWLRRRSGTWILFAVTALSIAFYEWAGWSGYKVLQHQLPGQLSFFCLGALVHYHNEFFLRHAYKLGVIAALLFAWHRYAHWYVLRPFAVAVLVMVACLALPVIRIPHKLGDLSYGTYLYHSPIIQALDSLGLFLIHPWLGVLTSLILVEALALPSWHFVERPWLLQFRKKSL
jgi:peptidoglycan/LPS O-acetylase OafA/YrhL